MRINNAPIPDIELEPTHGYLMVGTEGKDKWYSALWRCTMSGEKYSADLKMSLKQCRGIGLHGKVLAIRQSSNKKHVLVSTTRGGLYVCNVNAMTCRYDDLGVGIITSISRVKTYNNRYDIYAFTVKDHHWFYKRVVYSEDANNGGCSGYCSVPDSVEDLKIAAYNISNIDFYDEINILDKPRVIVAARGRGSLNSQVLLCKSEPKPRNGSEPWPNPENCNALTSRHSEGSFYHERFDKFIRLYTVGGWGIDGEVSVYHVYEHETRNPIFTHRNYMATQIKSDGFNGDSGMFIANTKYNNIIQNNTVCHINGNTRKFEKPECFKNLGNDDSPVTAIEAIQYTGTELPRFMQYKK